MTDIILLEPENSGNIGACARVMKNFGFERLILINPVKIDDTAIARAKHGKDVLLNAKITDKSVLEEYDTLVATTAKLGTDYNVPRSAISPSELANRVNQRKNVGILIGREGTGLSNEELKKCDFTVSIPASREYPTLNISHALAILLYELCKDATTLSDSGIEGASKKDMAVLLDYIEEAIGRIDWQTKEKKDITRLVWKQVLGKAMLTKRQAFAIMGFFRKLK